MQPISGDVVHLCLILQNVNPWRNENCVFIISNPFLIASQWTVKCVHSYTSKKLESQIYVHFVWRNSTPVFTLPLPSCTTDHTKHSTHLVGLFHPPHRGLFKSPANLEFTLEGWQGGPWTAVIKPFPHWPVIVGTRVVAVVTGVGAWHKC